MIALLIMAAVQALGAIAPAGYVVRTDSNSVYLDLGSASGAAVGQPFVIYKEGAELKHPVTGKSLGKLEETVAEGTIKEVRDLYSVGFLKAPGEVKPGQRARLVQTAAPAAVPAPTATITPSPVGQAAGKAPRWRTDVFNFEITAMTVADLDGDGKSDTALSDGRKLYQYGYPPKPKEKGAEFEPEINAIRLYSLEAADLDGDGKAEVFASLYNDTFQRFETLVLELDGGKWVKVAELPGVVRSHQDGEGKAILATQKIIDDKTFPYSTIYPLTWEGGKYAAGKTAIRPKRVEWIHDFTLANLDGTSPATLSLTSTELLRVQFEKGQWKTSDAYSQTPLRVRWANRVLSFRPHMVARYQDGRFGGLYLVRNKAALGGLAQPFGLFTGGELVRKDWNGVSLDDGWAATLGGYASDIALLPNEIAVAVVGTAGKSSIWAYDP